MRLGLQIPDFTWPSGAEGLGSGLADVARAADDAGMEFLAVMDHFFQISYVGPPENEMLEAYTTLGYLAAHTSRINLLTVMTGVHYRTPGLLAKTISTLDVLSGGRAWLGIGAGWYEEESRGLGFGFPPLAERFERLDEALRIYLRMCSGDEEPFHGKHFQLDRPLNAPQPLTRPHPPIMIGGGGERKTLRLVARYAQACNLFNTPDLEHKLDVLREHCAAEGRDFDQIRKTVYLALDAGPDGERTDELLAELERLAGLGFDTAIGYVPEVWRITPVEALGREVIPKIATW